MNSKYKGTIYAQDGDGIARVYGYGNTRDQAIGQCRLACDEYLRDRPDIVSLQIVECSDPINSPFSYQTVARIRGRL